MPFTPLHFPYAWLLSRIDKRLPLPALIVGAVIPDIEVPFLYVFFSGIFPDHYILHSLIGSLTIGLVLAVFIVRYFYPYMVSTLFGIDENELRETCKISGYMVLAVAIGIVSHLLVDYPMHPYNQIFWPFVDETLLVGQLVSFFAMGTNLNVGYQIANTLMTVSSIVLWGLIAYYIRDDLWHRMWMGDRSESVSNLQTGSGDSH